MNKRLTLEEMKHAWTADQREEYVHGFEHGASAVFDALERVHGKVYRLPADVEPLLTDISGHISDIIAEERTSTTAWGKGGVA